MELVEKRIIVTGCASGMGAATVRAYVKAGAQVVGMDIADKIAQVPTGPQGKFSQDVPQIPIIINKASRYTFE